MQRTFRRWILEGNKDIIVKQGIGLKIKNSIKNVKYITIIDDLNSGGVYLL